jgi:hypothetical protein
MRISFLLAVFIGLVAYYFQTANRFFFVLLGFGKELEDVGIEGCKTIHRSLEGCEDMRSVAPGKVLLSCGNLEQRHHGWFPPTGKRNPKHVTNDDFYLLDIETEAVSKMKVAGLSKSNSELVLHGISVLKLDDGEFKLAAVNHRRTGSCITMFDGSVAGELKHVETVCHPLIYTPNSVVLTGHGSDFYVTNDHQNLEMGVRRTVEDFLRTHTTNAVFCGKEASSWSCRIVADKISYANGINLSKDKKQVLVASSTRGEVYVYNRMQNNDLELAQTVVLDQGLDNITVDEDTGDVLVAGFPSLLKYLDFAKDPSNPAKKCPGGLVKLQRDSKGFYHSKRVYLDSTGNLLSGTTVGLKADGKTLIGAVSAPGIVVCDSVL